MLLLVIGILFQAGIASSPVAKAAASRFVVAKDGSGNFQSVQAAVNAVPANSTSVVIYIKSGTYQEVVTVPANKPNITFYGQDALKTIITGNNFNGEAKPGGGVFGTGDSATVLIEANDFNAYNVTFQNTHGKGAQAVAIRVNGDRDVFRNCRFIGYQDTLYADHTGRQYYNNSYIEGAVDFIFGNATAVFDNDEIHTVGQGFLTAQSRTSSSQTTGYVITNSRLTVASASADLSYLGRPWRPFSRVVYLNTVMAAHIRPVGWLNWNNTNNFLTSYYAEFQSSGAGAASSSRATWSHQLTASEATQFSIANFLNQDGWLTTANNSLNTLIAAGFKG